jgi:H+/Cl- antiporter ClcA
MSPPERPLDTWLLLWVLGIGLGLIGIPALLGFLAGSRLDQGGPHLVPWRLVFVSLGVGLGGLTAWRVIGRPSSK